MLSKINLHLLDLELFLYFEKHFENPVISWSLYHVYILEIA